jgi:hypothetical protein
MTRKPGAPKTRATRSKFLDHFKANFDTVLRAASMERLALLDCLDTRTNKEVAVVVVVDRDGAEYTFTPFAVMLDGDPYDYLAPPDPDGGFDMTAIESATQGSG